MLRLIYLAAFVSCIALHLTPILTFADENGSQERAFYMGFTPFPYDFSIEAVVETNENIREHGDIVSLHFDGGVPWTEALDDKPYHPKLMEDWNNKRNAAKGKKRLISVTPLNNGRNAMANYRGKDENMPLPATFQSKAFNDPMIKKAYLQYCRQVVAYFQPDYFAIGIEVNELFHNTRDSWDAYVELHKHTYAALKKEYPELPIFTTMTLHNLRNPGWNDIKEQQEAMKAFLDHIDMLGVSYYPFMAGHSETPNEHFDWIRAFTEKPIAITETGYLAEELKLESFGITLHGTPEKQNTYFTTLLERANRDDYRFVISFLYRDYDALWEKIKSFSPEAFMVWRDCGMTDETGKPRPALNTWKSWYQRNYVSSDE